MSAKDKIIKILEQRGEVRPTELADELSISQQMVHRHLKALVQDGVITKLGASPRTFYKLSTSAQGQSTGIESKLTDTIREVIEQNFMHITPVGKRMHGVEAFVHWCDSRGLDVLNMAQQYTNILNKYTNLRKSGLLDATDKVRNTFAKLPGGLCVDEVYYIDFYAIEIFDKTKLGQELLYAKQSQDTKAIKKIVGEVRPKIMSLIESAGIDAVVFVPPTVKRKVQFMKMLERGLHLPLPKVEVLKVIGDVAVPQKTLKTLSDRVENANASFMLQSKGVKYGKVLIIDDAVGSGASINQIAHKLKSAGVAGKVLGLAITGSLNNFDVISEV